MFNIIFFLFVKYANASTAATKVTYNVTALTKDNITIIASMTAGCDGEVISAALTDNKENLCSGFLKGKLSGKGLLICGNAQQNKTETIILPYPLPQFIGLCNNANSLLASSTFSLQPYNKGAETVYIKDSDLKFQFYGTPSIKETWLCPINSTNTLAGFIQCGATSGASDACGSGRKSTNVSAATTSTRTPLYTANVTKTTTELLLFECVAGTATTLRAHLFNVIIEKTPAISFNNVPQIQANNTGITFWPADKKSSTSKIIRYLCVTIKTAVDKAPKLNDCGPKQGVAASTSTRCNQANDTLTHFSTDENSNQYSVETKTTGLYTIIECELDDKTATKATVSQKWYRNITVSNVAGPAGPAGPAGSTGAKGPPGSTGTAGGSGSTGGSSGYLITPILALIYTII